MGFIIAQFARLGLYARGGGGSRGQDQVSSRAEQFFFFKIQKQEKSTKNKWWNW